MKKVGTLVFIKEGQVYRGEAVLRSEVRPKPIDTTYEAKR
jgi:hypothetical protein